MGCKIFKSLSYDNQEVVKRKRHGKRSGHRRHSRGHQSKDEIIPTENPPQDVLNNSQNETKPLLPTRDDLTNSQHETKPVLPTKDHLRMSVTCFLT
jgi:hypothetical protein